MKPAARLAQIKPSPTLALNAKAKELRAQGRPIINLSVGEPDFDTPEHIKQGAIAAIHAGKTKYTAPDGTPELKTAIINKFRQENKLDYQISEIIISVGAKHSLYNIAQALIDEGDEVIIPAPYWVSYPDIVMLAGGKPIIIEASFEQHFKITAEQLEKAITPKTKFFILNSPSNPTGMDYSLTELKALAEVLKKHPHVNIISDDIYEHIRWSDQSFVNIVNACPELKDRTLVVNGVSKGYAMTGWRIGYIAGPEVAITAMRKIQSQSTSNPCSIAQEAARTALEDSASVSCIENMVKAFKKRHDLVTSRLNNIPGMRCLAVQGTFYAFVNVEGVIAQRQDINSDSELAELLLNKANVASVPGSAFGSPGHLRLSYALDEATLTQALDQIEQVLR
ncbi:aspartate aminotransferase [Piscirickettsia salmonis]|uniref:Aminotransferase n=1 Tax=Piscirickettsia salmonis TaxID=1238 RepID=A0A9Q5VD64_PISSA|nr:pyridoxal phosphate-dependent aminotransferase [Piscirickettsia salmonis]ALA26090.1 degT/DnrJ/EryC1/StrS aminotransferase family protein [Piscirickettsia salmonis]APS43540.1 aspartate aminotransferase [Piscirickettsia salmonis]APS46894.1 aspartate aminotransferase [Piscirickettsia salmonis]APS51655.1 aspartate aminotransferase [Piscirickettsia salmonis]APS54872.1 aspartate aminotransferase [Piscirickettsia salmonis]